MLNRAARHNSVTSSGAFQPRVVRLLVCAGVCAAATPLVFSGPLVTVLVVSGLAVGMIALASPIAGVPLLFFAGSIGDLQHFQGGYSVAKVLVLLLLIGFLAKLVIGKMPIRRSGLMPQVVLFLVVFIVVSLRGLGSGVHLRDVITVIGYPAAFLLTLNLLRTKRSIEWALGALVAGAVVVAVAALLERYAGFSLLAIIRDQKPVLDGSGVPGLKRMAGLMHDPNAAAYPQILAMPILVAAATAVKRGLAKLGLLCLAALSGMGLALTLSRSGYLGAGCGVLCLALYLPHKQRVRIFAAAGVTLAVVLLFVPSEMLTARFKTIPTELGGVSDRSIYYLTALKLVRQSPLLGVGDAKFMDTIDQEVGAKQGPHSNILSIAVDSGLVGFASLLWLLVSYVGFVHRGLVSMPASPLKTYAIGAYAGLIGFQVQGLFISNMGWFLIWAMAAIPLCCVLVHQSGARIRREGLAVGKELYDGEAGSEALLRGWSLDNAGARVPLRPASLYALERRLVEHSGPNCPRMPAGSGEGRPKG